MKHVLLSFFLLATIALDIGHAEPAAAKESVTIELLPTIATLVGTELPNCVIDGHDIQPLMFGNDEAKSQHDRTYLDFPFILTFPLS